MRDQDPWVIPLNKTSTLSFFFLLLLLLLFFFSFFFFFCFLLWEFKFLNKKRKPKKTFGSGRSLHIRNNA